MKVLLFDMENQVNPEILEEAFDIVKATTEYDINNTEPGYFHCISTQPAYHVEISLKDEGMADAKCHCTAYKKSRKCKHAVAALLLLRDYLQRHRKSRRKTNRETLEEVIRKMNISDLKSFIAAYAMSHSALRADILSNFLYLTKRPDYHNLYNDLAPLDKYGQLRINRNNIKTVRSVSTTLLKRAQELLKEQALSEALQILEAVLIHTHKFWSKLPQFQEQLMADLKYAYKLFELFCNQPMALRLQQRASLLALNISDRESYVFPQGKGALIQIAEHFLLEEKSRKEAFAIAEKKAKSDNLQSIKWMTLLFHWMRLWSFNISGSTMKHLLEKKGPEIISEMNREGAYEDVLFAIKWIGDKVYDTKSNYVILQAGMRSARMAGDQDLLIQSAYNLAVKYIDEEAWFGILEVNKVKAIETLHIIGELYPAGSENNADMLVLKGWNTLQNGPELLSRLKATGDINLLMLFDLLLREKHEAELEDLYATMIHTTREMYGGVMARQKLNIIFSHLKSVNLFQAVADKIKIMENTKQMKEENGKGIKGFVFDLDGVIVDTAEHHYQSWKKILQELGAEITKEDDHHTRGASRMESLEFLTEKYNIVLTDEEKHKWADRKNKIYLEAIQHITPDDILPGAVSFLQETKKLGLQIALGSASKNARMVLTKLGIADRFDAIIDGNDAKKSKPDPEVFVKASEALGLKTAEVVVFEDAGKGVQAALAAGCRVVGVGDKTTLSNADIVIPDLNHASPAQIIQQLA